MFSGVLFKSGAATKTHIDYALNDLIQLFDLPKMINSKLPMNNFNSMVEDSEHNVANWTGKFHTVSALVILLTSLMYVLSPIWNGGMGEGSAIVGNVLSMLIWDG